MQTFDMSGMSGIANTTLTNMTLDTKGILVTNSSLSSSYSVPCKLFYFNVPTVTNGIITQTPLDYGSFNCTGVSPGLVTITNIPLNSSQITTIQTNLHNGKTTQSFMIFPLFNSTMRTNLDNNNYQYGIEKHQIQFYFKGDGFDCAIISGSGLCNFLNNPWEANATAYGKSTFGDWFYVIVFFPFPMVVYLITRNGLYAGFVGLGIMLVIETINRTVFEIALTMLAIAGGFTLYEVIRKRLFE